MTDIAVAEAGGGFYDVTITEDGSQSTHRVFVAESTLERLAPGLSAPALVTASFRFLLDREPKEAILSSFDLPIIGQYFPEYEAALVSYLQKN